MELAVLIAIVMIGVLIGLLAFLIVMNMITSQYLAWASSIRSWTPPVVNNTIECPQGYIITSTNKSGVYQCGPCLAYLAPSGSLSIACPR